MIQQIAILYVLITWVIALSAFTAFFFHYFHVIDNPIYKFEINHDIYCWIVGTSYCDVEKELVICPIPTIIIYFNLL